jgi:hypothetical protein
MVILALFSCASPPPPPAPAEDAPVFVPLDAPRLARRLSLDLRGVLPTTAELDAVEANPSSLDPLVDEWMADPRFEDRLVAMFAEQWHTRVDAFGADWYDFGLLEEDEHRFEVAVGEEPLRLLAHVATRDLPWSEVVTADYTLVNEVLGPIWPVAYPEGGEGWQVVSWTDGRPAAGVLATNGLWWRYQTDPFNQNRTRAAAIFRLLTCEDFPARPVSFAESSTEFAGVASADRLSTDPYCLACHAAIEPVASAMYGFWWFRQYSPTEMLTYHAEREQLGVDNLGTSPAWFGEPVEGLADLGRHIAADGRFRECAVRTMATALWRRAPSLDDQPTLEDLETGFADADLRMPALLRALLAGEEYRAGGVAPDAPAAVVEAAVTRRLVSPDQLDTVLRDLTGFSWRQFGYDQLANDTFGFRMLMNGVDGEYVTTPAQDPTLTWSLVTARAAQAAAWSAVRHDLVDADAPHLLLDGVTLATRPTDDAFETELAALHWRLLARRADEDDLSALTALWSDLEASSGAEAAWVGVVSALLQHPEFLSY